MIVASKNVFINQSLHEVRSTIKNIQREHNDKYGFNDRFNVSVICHIEFTDKLKNKTKKVTINDYYVIWIAMRREIASNHRYQMNRVNKLMCKIEDEKNKFVMTIYLKMQIPCFWRKFCMKIANNRDFKYNICNNPYNKFQRFCLEWYSYNLLERRGFPAVLYE